MNQEPQLFVALHRDYSDLELPYSHVILIGHTGLMRLWRGIGHTYEEALQDAEDHYISEVLA